MVRSFWQGNPLATFVLLAAAAMFMIAGCGYVGDPLPPALYIPLPITELSTVQVGDEIAIQFTLPARTTEDLAVDEVEEIDLRVAEWENRDWDSGAWEREATRLSTLPVEDRVVIARTPATPWVGKRVLVRARVSGKLGRFSAWSEPVALRVIPPGSGVRGLAVAEAPEGVRVSWESPSQPVSAMETEVYRKTPEAEEFTLLGSAKDNEWRDPSARFGETYVYRVRQRVTGEERNFMSRFTEPQTITPEDTFAPAVPKDVAAVTGATGVELSWTRNLETDFRAYRVYRSVDGGEFSPLGEPTPTPTFSDREAPTGVPLRYRITSLDEAGNESAPSEPVAITLP